MIIDIRQTFVNVEICFALILLELAAEIVLGVYMIHFPGRNGIVEKKTYDCPKMMDKYVCALPAKMDTKKLQKTK